MATSTASISVQQYTIGWISALALELAAATALLDAEHSRPSDFRQRPDDANHYTWGAIGEHKIVIACLVGGRYGTVSAATTALTMKASLPHLRFFLMVGIGAGVPQPDNDPDIRLGDVIVSRPAGSSPGVIQYDLGKVKPDGQFELVGSLRSPPDVLLNAIVKLESQHLIERRSRIPELLEVMYKRRPGMKEPDDDGNPGFVFQGHRKDRLFKAGYRHVDYESSNDASSDEDTPSCQACDPAQEVKRKERKTTTPRIHYGTIASGDSVIKDAQHRDDIAGRLTSRPLCFEMEAAGLMNALPCIVIRGICDYADTHKNDIW